MEGLIHVHCEMIITIGSTHPSSHVDKKKSKKGKKIPQHKDSQDLLSQPSYTTQQC